MSFVTVAAGFSVGMGLNTIMGNPLGLGGGGQQGQQAQQMVDPFAPYRQSYAQLLNQYMGMGVGGAPGGTPTTLGGGPFAMRQAGAGAPTGPGMTGMSPTFGLNDPAYQTALDIGLQGVQRANPGASGNALLALQKYGVTYQDQFSQEMFNQLAMLSGATTSPVYGGQAGINAANAASANQSTAMGGMMTGLSKLFPSSTGTNPDVGTNVNSNYWNTGVTPQTFMGGGGTNPFYGDSSGGTYDFSSPAAAPSPGF